MAIPTYDQFIEPVLRYLAAHPDGAPAREVYEAAADALGLSAEERAELLPSQIQPVYHNRAGWAHDRLKRAGWSSSPQRGRWKLTPAGLEYHQKNPAPLSSDVIKALAALGTSKQVKPNPAVTITDQEKGVSPNQPAVASPDDQIEAALTEIRDSVAAELREKLSGVSPQHFEMIVLDLLHTMGYGTSRTDLQRVGGSGDAGIDGIISLDRLGLEKVYIQAKRWQNVVGRPEVQGFYGALAGQRANKGVFITTSTFTPQAVEFARSVERIVLIDGNRLAMIEHGIGVAQRAIKIPRVDSDYFES